MTDNVGARLRNVRARSGLTQRGLAKKAGVASSTVSLIESGRISPSVGSLKRLLDAAGHCRLVSGLNAPMLWRSLCYGDQPLDALVGLAAEGGRAGVVVADVPPPRVAPAPSPKPE